MLKRFQLVRAHHCEHKAEHVCALIAQIVEGELDVGLRGMSPAYAPEDTVRMACKDAGVRLGARGTIKHNKIVGLGPTQQLGKVAIDKQHCGAAAHAARANDIETRYGGTRDSSLRRDFT